MPIVINEIEISVEVVPDKGPNATTPADESFREELIKECVEKVMELINLKNER
ncbi:DUF5908 family protein [Rubrolithibacter danxiaensis]|uniref:DUF5908 family protein n=1 Tax=Rubrolithibacter danxiaensis TaxID=3390805 RepID=UPI003BF91F14